jgi:glycosyltransferase involved in cell wall biosynthesis
VVKEFKPDLLVTLGELRMIEWLAPHPLRAGIPWVAYVPVDGEPFYPPWRGLFEGMQEIVAMSDFGRRVLESGLEGRRVHRILHGVDRAVFRPLPDRARIKAHPRFLGKFVVGCVARNQTRKNLPALVQAFALLAPRYPDLHLYLHSTPCDDSHDLVELLKRHHLNGRADLSTRQLRIDNALADVELNELYNLFDVVALPTCAEGFGLPILEAMACGVPAVATDCSACTELLRGRGELAAVRTWVTLGHNILEQAIVDVDHLARCIERLYLDVDLRERYSRAGRAFAESLSWDNLVPEWLKVLSSVSGVDLASDTAQAQEGAPR